MSLAIRAALGFREEKRWHTAVDDVSFSIARSENVGLVGLNGAGKSSLLSIISGAMEPDSGVILRNGTVAAVLALGQGMNPQLPGRENAYLFARTLGASRSAVKNAISQIIEFSELGDAFDAPMRTYSSGMRARLSFATAMSVESDLLILDETLAVGDLNFRFKCYDLLQERKDSNKAMMMVSHNPLILSRFCERIIVMDKGKVVYDGAAAEALIRYKEIRLMQQSRAPDQNKSKPTFSARVGDDAPRKIRATEEVLTLPFDLSANQDVSDFSIRIGIMNAGGTSITADEVHARDLGIRCLKAGDTKRIVLKLTNKFAPGKIKFVLTINLLDENDEEYLVLYDGKFHAARVLGQETGAIVRL